MSDSKPLFDAIRAGDLDKVRDLLDADPSLAGSSNEAGISPVLASVYSGRAPIRELLLSRGAQLGLADAAAIGSLDRVRDLVQNHHESPRALSSDGFPVVALACVFGHLEVARYLAAQGADVNAPASNATGYTALTGAVTSGHTPVVQWLLELGADPNYRYGPGYTPLLAAAANGHLDIVKLLLAHGADRSAATSDGKTALSLAEERHHTSVASFLRAS